MKSIKSLALGVQFFLTALALLVIRVIMAPVHAYAMNPRNGVVCYAKGDDDEPAGTTFLDIKTAVENIGKSWEQFKTTNEEREKARANGEKAKEKELDEKLEKFSEDITKFVGIKKGLETALSEYKERLEALEAREKRPGVTAAAQRQDEYKNAFLSWVRDRGSSPEAERKMTDLSRKMAEAKDITTVTGSGGGFAVPSVIATAIEQLELKLSPVRRLVKTVQVGSSDYKELINLRGASSGWVGETGSRNASNTPQLREVVPTFGELYAYPQASEWSLDDMFFNVEQWLMNEVAQEFALQEGDAVIRGNGSSKPTGMINTSPVATPDGASPLRNKVAYECVDSTLSPTGIDPDDLLTLIYSLNSAYRAGALFVMNSVTTGRVRKMKDGNNQYLWAPGLQSGQPDRLLGYGVETWEQMDDVATGKFPIAFGNFQRGYVLADRVGLRITRDNVTNVGFVRFYVRRREGGIVLNNDAIKFIKVN